MPVLSALCLLVTAITVTLFITIARRHGQTVTRGEMVIAGVVVLLSMVPFFGLLVAVFSVLATIGFAYECNKDHVDNWFNKPVFKNHDVQSHEDDR